MSINTDTAHFKLTHALIYIFGLILLYSIFLLAMPVRMGDTDMWYHLNGGRYFWEFFSVPDTAFFSFINPDKEWTNYFWGFQAIIYKIYELGGYSALLATRAILSIATIIILFLILRKKLTTENALIFITIFAAFLLVYEGRAHQLRPHLFSYLFILCFFYILHFKHRYAPALPFITILWANIHGVEWPVPALICGTYALPVIIKLVKKKQTGIESPLVYLTSIFLCSLAFLINPYGFELFLAPFNIDSDTYLYIGELIGLNYQTLTTIQISAFKTVLHSALSLLFILFGIYFLIGLKNKDLSLPAIILYLGGCLLLYKGVRFIWEWILLCIPLMLYILDHQGNKPLIREFSNFTRHIFYILVLAISANTLYEKAKSFGNYPFDTQGLPRGAAEFLINTGSSGKVFSPPTTSGYLEWKLYPDYKTYIDMQFPPSTDMNMYEISRAFKDEYALEQFLEKYQPDWVLLPVNHQPSSKNIGSHEKYVPVFSGDNLVVYANKSTNEHLVDKYELKYLDVHNLSIKDGAEKENYIVDLKKLLSLYPDSVRVTQALASYYREENEHEKAREYAMLLTRLAPKNPNSHYLLGITLRDLEMHQDAIPALENALKYSIHSQKYIVEQAIASTYYFANQFSDAYRLFKKSVNPYLKNVSPDMLYMYALSATIHGDLNGANKLLNMILYSTNPETHEDIITQSKDLKQKIMSGEFDTPSFLEWIMDKAWK